MNLELSDTQALFLDALEGLLDRYRTPPQTADSYVSHHAGLQTELIESGFLNIAVEQGYGDLDAALMVERVARLPWCVEAAGSALVGPLLGPDLQLPLALVGDPARPARNLPIARTAVVRTAQGYSQVRLDEGQVAAIESVLAYPIGLMPAAFEAQPLEASLGDEIQRRWRVAIAAEAAGLMRGALDATVEYVTHRRQFRQPLGNFQAVQHRLASCEQKVQASLQLALRAAASEDPTDAATALLYIQQQLRTLIYDCHQFSGAMGLTLEYPLHLWTYRLKWLQGELGGRRVQAEALAGERWAKAG